MFDDYICQFTKVDKYPEYDEVHIILRDCVRKEDYTLEVLFEMKTLYENLDKFDFYRWHQEKKNDSMIMVVRIIVTQWIGFLVQ